MPGRMRRPTHNAQISWFTFRVRGSDDRPVRTSRRALLAAGLAGSAATLAGGRPPGSGGTAPGTKGSPHPLDALLSGALALVGRYDAAIAGQPALSARLTPLRAQHWTHLAVLSPA